VLAEERLLDQLRHVVRAFRLAPRARPFSRCSACNALLVPATRDEVAAEVPPRVLASEQQYRRCPGCGRVYWRGSHAARMKTVLDRVLAEP
jgi:uncharacterized protein with PIN domain